MVSRTGHDSVDTGMQVGVVDMEQCAQECKDRRYQLSDLVDDLEGGRDPDDAPFSAERLLTTASELALAHKRRWLGHGKAWKTCLLEISVVGHADRMAWTVRRACVDDAADIARINVVSWKQAYRGIVSADYLHRMDVSEHVGRWQRLLAENGNSVVFVAVSSAGQSSPTAYCMVRCSTEQSDNNLAHAKLVALYADPAVFGSGAGAAVHNAGLQHLAAHGTREAVVWVAADNHRARRFYTRNGWHDDSNLDEGRDVYLVADQLIPIVRYRYRFHPLSGDGQVHRGGAEDGHLR